MVAQPVAADRTEVSQQAARVTRTSPAVVNERVRANGEHEDRDEEADDGRHRHGTTRSGTEWKVRRRSNRVSDTRAWTISTISSNFGGFPASARLAFVSDKFNGHRAMH
jgi:hypothetical protein